MRLRLRFVLCMFLAAVFSTCSTLPEAPAQTPGPTNTIPSTRTLQPTNLPAPTTSPAPEQNGQSAAPTPITWKKGAQIAYIKDSIDPDYEDDNALYILDLGTNQKINVFDGLPGVRRRSFFWSPQGSWLLFGEYNRSDMGLEEMIRPYNLWVVRPDGSERHRLMAGVRTRMVRWISDEKKLFVNSESDSSDSEIFIADPQNGKAQKMPVMGRDPQPSPDGKKFAFIKGDKAIYITDDKMSKPDKVFSAEVGTIPGYSWSNDQESILTAVVNKPGCENNSDGSTTFFKVDIQSREARFLREVKWSIYGWNLSPNQNLLLTSWWLCIGNAYELDGVLGLNTDLTVWPLDRFVSYQWTQDSRYIIGTDWATQKRYFLDPGTGEYISDFVPDFLNPLLTREERDHYVFITWKDQPVPDEP